MLIWLDGGVNRRNAPNENYGRELLELYTLGIGNYDEDDVLAAARSFTGWNLRTNEFFFDETQHDAGDKTFLGSHGTIRWRRHPGHRRGRPRNCPAHRRPDCSRSLPTPTPSPKSSPRWSTTYTTSGHDIRALVEAILRSDAFYSERSQFEHIKSPVEYVVGSVRTLGATVRERELVPVLRTLGQEILNPPNVAGWPGGAYWINPTTLLTRFNFAARLATAAASLATARSSRPPTCWAAPTCPTPPASWTGCWPWPTAWSCRPRRTRRLSTTSNRHSTYPPGFNGQPNPQQRQAATDARLRGLILLALASSDYQVG